MVSACDAGTPHGASTEIGPPLHVVGFNAADGGILPADGTIQIAFDRLLSPGTVTRQAFTLQEGAGAVLNPTITYDPIARVVSLGNPIPTGGPWLTAGATYYVEMSVAKASDDVGLTGVKAIDGATLPAGVTEAFRAAAAAPGAPTLPEDRFVDFCNDVLPIFVQNCSGGPCHSGPGAGYEPREGLILDAPFGLANTAIGRVSQESNTGAIAGLPRTSESLFGVDMPIIDPGSPGNSWLMYKVLLAPGPAATTSPGLVCVTGAPAPTPVSQATAANPAAPSVPLATSERAILADRMLGREMPYPPTGPLGLDEMERIRAWIAQGANVQTCPNDCQ